jgi:hypothetical protein
MVEKIAYLLPRKKTHNDNYICAFVCMCVCVCVYVCVCVCVLMLSDVCTSSGGAHSGGVSFTSVSRLAPAQVNLHVRLWRSVVSQAVAHAN